MTDSISQYGKISQAETKLRTPVGKTVADGKPADPVPTVEASTSKVEMSSIKAMADRAMSSPDINMGKVEQIKQAIKEGSYPVDPQRIAESFLALEHMISD